MDYITKKLLKKTGLGCPICGSASSLTITQKNFYEELVREHGSSMVIIRCSECFLELNQYGDDGESYSSIIKKAWDKWCDRNKNEKEEDV